MTYRKTVDVTLRDSSVNSAESTQSARSDARYTYYSIAEACRERGVDVHTLPYSLRILLESLLRKGTRDAESGEYTAETAAHIDALVHYDAAAPSGEVPFKPSRIVLQDFTGVPVVVDLASMRDAIVAHGGKAEDINPEIPVDLVIDHSVQVDVAGRTDALRLNMQREFERNAERYEFLKWAEKSFENYRVVPPATGIIHQVNIEFLSDVILHKDGLAFPDSMFGTDSHTTMINGLGVLGWGVGGIEAEAAMLGEASYFPVPEVIGVHLTGELPACATATDLALRLTNILREAKVVGKFVEYFGPGLSTLSLADRATIANMAPEYGATCGYFPIDAETLRYMQLTNRAEETIALVDAYAHANDLFYDASHDTSDSSADASVDASAPTPRYTKVIELDLSTVFPSISGPKRPQDLIPLSRAKQVFRESLTRESGVQGFGLSAEEIDKTATATIDGRDYEMKTGHVAIAAITSCTNTSNPYVLMSAGLLARNAVRRGLSVSPTVKTSLAPGSKVVTGYLKNSGLQDFLDQLGFQVVGYGCTTCIGNSGPLSDEVSKAITDSDLLVSGVLSGNRNFEGRINPLVKANFLASPPLVVAYALAGTTDIDLTTEPLGTDSTTGEPVYLKDLMPDKAEVDDYVRRFVTRDLFAQEYSRVFDDNEAWNAIETADGQTYAWNEDSTYIQNPPYFDSLDEPLAVNTEALQNLTPLAKFGDTVTTDHISPAGAIALNSPAGRYLTDHAVTHRDFNSYGSRRGNHEVMMRGTFANIRITNELADGKVGGYTTRHGELTTMYDAAMAYKKEGVGTLVIAGKDYGMGSSRDWAAKGTGLLGVKAVLAESFERIHRSNLVMMGILPLQFMDGMSAEKLGLTGHETYDIALSETPRIHDVVTVTATSTDSEGRPRVTQFSALVRFDAQADIEYYTNGGILPMVVRKKLGATA
ncbi:aconitate hydratase AcnA [Alloscardovia macacae]|uniref:Aconitate hydratase n=1 Tax=Alloscardovia macacae TaxID=1160091 RepID=A0A261F3N7_9BIFI|nr:aconitate hydratase AcnA [Alloscardovia macacae]OZG53749.1 aconitate hydratase [Alloscardovia macacae]